jgi:hypothetical protein
VAPYFLIGISKMHLLARFKYNRFFERGMARHNGFFKGVDELIIEDREGPMAAGLVQRMGAVPDLGSLELMVFANSGTGAKEGYVSSVGMVHADYMVSGDKVGDAPVKKGDMYYLALRRVSMGGRPEFYLATFYKEISDPNICLTGIKLAQDENYSDLSPIQNWPGMTNCTLMRCVHGLTEVLDQVYANPGFTRAEGMPGKGKFKDALHCYLGQLKEA